MYPNKQKDMKLFKSFKEKKFIDEKMAGYITDKIVARRKIIHLAGNGPSLIIS